MKRLLMLGAMMAAGFPALAQEPAQVIAFLDKNGDGKCDLNEYLTFQQPRLAEFDKNMDGELSLNEFKDSLQGKSKQNAKVLFEGTNAEGGKGLTSREFLGYHAWVFRTYVDTDKDGFMSASEWSAVMGRN